MAGSTRVLPAVLRRRWPDRTASLFYSRCSVIDRLDRVRGRTCGVSRVGPHPRLSGELPTLLSAGGRSTGMAPDRVRYSPYGDSPRKKNCPGISFFCCYLGGTTARIIRRKGVVETTTCCTEQQYRSCCLGSLPARTLSAEFGLEYQSKGSFTSRHVRLGPALPNSSWDAPV